MKTKRQSIKKSPQRKSSNLMLYIILGFAMILGIVAITQNDRSTFELRKKADSITPTATPSATLTPTPTPKNIIPTCLGLSISPLEGTTPLDLTLSCAGVDGNNDITAAEFEFGDGKKRTVEKGVGQYGTITTKVRYDNEGSYVVTCRVRDNNYEWSDIPSACRNTVSVSKKETIVTTPKPTATPYYEEPTPTQKLETPTPTEIITPIPTVTPTPPKSFVSQETLFMIGKISLISVVTILVALILKKLIDGN